MISRTDDSAVARGYPGTDNPGTAVAGQHPGMDGPAVFGWAAGTADAIGSRPAALDENHHADVSGGWLRAAVFGAMDGLVTNIALIAGVGGGGVSPRAIVITGTSGLVAGAISMALGEYTSVRTQNEQLDHEVAKERYELERHPEVEAAELARKWIDRGLPEELAYQVAVAFSQNPEEALRVHAQEELGLDPHKKPSPWAAAISSFLCFAAGALVPLLPYLLGATLLWISLLAGAAGLLLAGALVSRFTNRPWWLNGGRQLLFGAAAAGATYLIGTVIGGGGVA